MGCRAEHLPPVAPTRADELPSRSVSAAAWRERQLRRHLVPGPLNVPDARQVPEESCKLSWRTADSPGRVDGPGGVLNFGPSSTL